MKVVLPQNFEPLLLAPLSSFSTIVERSNIIFTLGALYKNYSCVYLFVCFSFLEESGVFTLSCFLKFLTEYFGDVFFIHCARYWRILLDLNIFFHYFVDNFIPLTLSVIPSIPILDLLDWSFNIYIFSISYFPSFVILFLIRGEYLSIVTLFSLCIHFYAIIFLTPRVSYSF